MGHNRKRNTVPVVSIPKMAMPQSEGKNIVTTDSFANLIAKLGIQQPSGNLMSNSGYQLGPFLSRDRLQLEAMYRSNWLVGQVVDTVAEDMTREGISLYSEMKPDDITKLQVSISEFGIWQDLCSTIKWARLYGGAIAVILIDGADYSKEMDLEKIRKDQFKGLVVLDRWMLQPAIGDLITDLCKDIGKPKYYEVISGVSTFPSAKIHHSRVIRFDGIELPYYQRFFENLWGLSVVERMVDRLLAFDSASQGAAQLLYKAYLRVVGVDGLREALANGGKEETGVIKQFGYMRLLQSNEGITLLDAKDTFNTHQYTFSGISDMLQQFGQQISGATGIPLVRLFGQSPAGLSATGESDLRNYYDHINKEQENKIRPELDKLMAVIAKSKLGYDLPEDFTFEFNPLWQLSETEKSTVAGSDVGAVAAAYGGGLIKKSTALKEMKQMSHITGRFTNITADDITDAQKEDDAPPADDLFGLESEGGGSNSEQPEAPDNANERMGGENPDIPDEKGAEEENEVPLEKPTGDSIIWKKFRDKMKNALLSAWRHNYDGDFEEADHPRAEGGQFTKKGTGKPSATKIDYEDLDENSKKKYERIYKMKKEFDKLEQEVSQSVGKDERASCLSLIMKTGIRPGSDKDTHAKVKAYGATTLEGRHIVEEDGKVFLRYVGKKGVNLNLPVSDPDLAKMLLQKKKAAGDNGRIFNVNAKKLSAYSHSLANGGDFKTKDFRTHVGTTAATMAINKIEAPKNLKEYKKKVMEVAKQVSAKLGNTPVVALQSYIDPRVFSSWRSEVEK